MLSSFAKYKVVYSHLWSTYGSSWWVRLSFILQIVSRVVKLIVLPLAISLIITSISKQNYDDAYKAVIFFGLFSFILGAITPLVRYIGMLGENKIYRNSTANYMAKLVSSDIDYFNSNLSGYLTTATRHYVDSSLQLVRALRNKYSTTILGIVFPLCVIFWFDTTLGVVALLLSIFQGGYVVWSSYAIDGYRKKSREIYKANSGKMADIISNILTIKSTAQEKSFIDATRQRATKESQIYKKRYSKQAVLTSYRELLTVIFFIILLSMTVFRMSTGDISITVAVLVITYTTTILTAIYALSEDIDEHDDFVDKIIPAFEILNKKNTIEDPVKPVELSGIKGDIVFDKVSFSYNKLQKTQTIFHGLSLVIPAGQKIGIVGASGAGKSTLTKLLLRFDDVDEGAVLVDGTDIRHMLQHDLRRNIALVPQEPMLFHTSIRDNVIVSKPNATDSEIDNALKIAHAHTFVYKLPDGINSVVGERGVKLSGGQKQRVAIARAVLQNAPIIILDEATSALDSESEQIIKDAFADILRGKTAIVAAHRLSTLSAMDRIIVIDNGKIVEDGTHNELLGMSGTYAKLWKYQLRLQV